jgi:uncharacterized membrane protein YbhN (UPF0104 family)
VLPLLVLVPLLDRRWMIRAQRWWQRRHGKQARDDLIPGQRAILLAWLWSAATMMVVSVAFALLLRGTASDAPLVTAISAFAFAWTIGFLALPFPAGLGVREATLLAVLGGLALSAAIIAAAVFLRLTLIGAEVAAIGMSSAFARFRGQVAPTSYTSAVREEVEKDIGEGMAPR